MKALTIKMNGKRNKAIAAICKNADISPRLVPNIYAVKK